MPRKEETSMDKILQIKKTYENKNKETVWENIALCKNVLSLMVTSAQVVETSVTTTDTVLLRTVSPLTIRLYYHRFSILRSFGKVWNRATSKFGTQAYITQGLKSLTPSSPPPPPYRFAPQ